MTPRALLQLLLLSLLAARLHAADGNVVAPEGVGFSTDRLAKVAELELGAQISSNLVPLLITEIMHPSRDVRGHFISLLYECAITSGPLGECYSQNGQPKNGQWAWFSEAPSELIHQHEVYKPFIQNDY